MIGVEVTPVLVEIPILYSPTKAKIPTKIIFPPFVLFFSHGFHIMSLKMQRLCNRKSALKTIANALNQSLTYIGIRVKSILEINSGLALYHLKVYWAELQTANRMGIISSKN